MVALDILSDPICPWCLIGKTRLDRAVERVGHDPFTRRWRMFRLNPDMPREGMDRRAYLDAKFGGPERAAAVYETIAETARADGLDLDLGGIARTPQTLDAHRLIRWAEVEGVAEPVVDALFDRYFRRGQDIADPALLADVAEGAGMERAAVERLLAGEADAEALVEEESAAREMGGTGVPCFVVQGRYVIEGAQDADTWARVIEEIAEALARGDAAPNGEDTR
ncbi:MAG: DsbA family oxidoreductase [Paracoccaceae bacterium]